MRWPFPSTNFSSFSFSNFKFNFGNFGFKPVQPVVTPAPSCDISRVMQTLAKHVRSFTPKSAGSQTQQDLCETICKEVYENKAQAFDCEANGGQLDVAGVVPADYDVEMTFEGAPVDIHTMYDASADVPDGGEYRQIACKLPEDAQFRAPVGDSFQVNQVQKYQGSQRPLKAKTAERFGPNAPALVQVPGLNRVPYQDQTIDSCDEYVYQKFWELSQWEDAVAPLGNDAKRMYLVAFGEDASINEGRIGLRDSAEESCDSSRQYVSEALDNDTAASVRLNSMRIDMAISASLTRVMGTQRVSEAESELLLDSACQPSVSLLEDTMAADSRKVRPRKRFL